MVHTSYQGGNMYSSSLFLTCGLSSSTTSCCHQTYCLEWKSRNMEKMMARTVLSRPSVTQRAFSAMTRCDTVVNGEPSVRTGFLSPAPRRSQPRPLSRYTAGRSRLARVGDLFELLPSCDFSMGFSFSRSCVQAICGP